jgi:hypothetical protein
MSKAGSDGRLALSIEHSHSLRSGISSRGMPHVHSHHQHPHGSTHGMSSQSSPHQEGTPAHSDDANGYHKYSDGNCSQISAEVTATHQDPDVDACSQVTSGASGIASADCHGVKLGHAMPWLPGNGGPSESAGQRMRLVRPPSLPRHDDR